MPNRKCSVCNSEDLIYEASVFFNAHIVDWEIKTVKEEEAYCSKCEATVNVISTSQDFPVDSIVRVWDDLYSFPRLAFYSHTTSHGYAVFSGGLSSENTRHITFYLNCEFVGTLTKDIPF